MDSDDEFQDCVEEQVQQAATTESTSWVSARRAGQFTGDDGFEYDIEESSRIDYFTAFKTEDQDLENIFLKVSPGNTALTAEMIDNPAPETHIVSKAKTMRLIFYADDYSEEEKAKILEFKTMCKENGVQVPENDPEILRFLVSRKMNPKAAYDSIIAKYKIRKEIYPRVINQAVFDLLSQGMVYIGGRDRRFRPIVVFNPKVIIETSPDSDDIITAMFMIHEYAITIMSHPGKIENCLSIMNIDGVSAWNVPFNKMKRCIPLFQGQYKVRARTVFVMNSPTTISVIFNTVKYLIDEMTAKKVAIYSSNTCKELQELVAPEQLEERFGGKAPNRGAGDYWPPKLPCMTFGHAEAPTGDVAEVGGEVKVDLEIEGDQQVEAASLKDLEHLKADENVVGLEEEKVTA